MTTESNSSAPNLKAGQKLAGCYLLARSIEVGAGDPIWLAQDEVLGKQVTLHFLPRSVATDPAAVEALRLEIKRNRPLIHPGVLRVYDLVEGDKWAAVAMDAFDGKCLAAILKEKGHLEVAQIEPWLDEICVTLEEAHRIKLTHRDLAPENFFVARSGRLLLANFGISRVIQDSLARTGAKSGAAPRIHTCSPQLLAGAAPTVADDVYGVGTLLFALLTGRPVFEGADVAEQIRNATPPRVSEVRDEADERGEEIPAGWDNVIAACLNKAADDRPHRAAEIVSSIEAYLPAELPPADEEPEAPAAPVVIAEAPVMEPVVAPVVEKIEKVEEPPPAPVAAEPLKIAVPESLKIAAPEPEMEKELEKPVEELAKPAEVAVPLHVVEAVEEKEKAPAKIETSSPFSKPAPVPRRPLPYDTDPSLFEQLRFPAAVLAAVILVLALVNHFFNAKDSASAPAISTTDSADRSELTSVKNSVREPSVAPDTAAPETAKTPPPEPKAVQNPSSTPAMVLAAGPTPTPPTPVASTTAIDKQIAEKAAALDRLKQDLAATEKTQQARMKEQQAAAAAVAEAQSAIEAKRKAAVAAKKVTDELVAARKKRQDDQKAADLASQAAQQLAADKARAADEARKALADFETQNRDKLAAQDKADTEVADLERKLADQQKLADENAKAAAAGEAARQQQIAAVQQQEQDLTQARSSIAQAAAEETRRKQSVDTERKKLDDEITAMRALFESKMKDIEDRRRQIETNPPGASGAPASTPAPPAAVVAPAATVAPVRAEIRPPAPATPAPTLPLMAKVETPKATPVPTPEPVVTPPVAVSASTNSLGMRFTPVGDVLFCIWQTRVKDFDAFANATKLKSTAWRGPGFRQGPDHPVVNVTWNEAITFCKWLTDKEHKEGTLPAAQFYRLPYDMEWSKAVGLPDETGKTAEARDMGVPDVYPWGTEWPPVKGAGNYTGEETGSDVAIKGYDDGFAWTAPVGSFPANKLGLYDMGGNVWQWCMDSWNTQSKAKVLRGASWYNGALKLSLLSSCRVHSAPDSSTDNYGFRIVRATEAAVPKAAKK